MRALAVVALAFVLALAGCGGVDAPAGTEGTVTPAAVPDDPVEEHAGSLAPGMTREGVFDPERLTDAHAAVLATTSYTVQRREMRTYRNGTVRSRYESTVQVSAGGDRFRYALEQADYRGAEERVRSIDRWMADGRGFERRESGGVSYRRLSNPDAVLPERATNRLGLTRILLVVDLHVTGTTRTPDGATLYHLGVEGGPEDLPPLREVSFEAVVREDGVVRSYDLTYLVEREGTTVRVTVQVAFGALGETQATRPLWHDEAVEALSADGTPPGPSPTDSSPTAAPSEASPPRAHPRSDSTGRSLAAFHAG
ncbi:DUF7537 family lipoprotein [Halomarina litorea]|uniref:DUF7537 family lipoprotein n=1 Tax=Halomarina litorea TaxID=2961595 RepID=UPI0020C21B16|nr:hypothetical protein [Halomarina sp. BCD28]